MRANDALIVLQAGSACPALPGRVLRCAAGQSLLARCLQRLLAANAAPLVLATTDRAEDDGLVQVADELGVPSIRSALTDALGQLARAVQIVEPVYVICATGHHAAVDVDAPSRVLRFLRRNRVDYVVERGLPAGAGVEGLRAAALPGVADLSTDPDDRGHVTAFLRRPGSRFRTLEPLAPPALRRPDLRFTVETADDLAFMEAVLARAAAGSALIPLPSIIRAADTLPGRCEVA